MEIKKNICLLLHQSIRILLTKHSMLYEEKNLTVYDQFIGRNVTEYMDRDMAG